MPPPPPPHAERACPPRRLPADILTLLSPSTSPCGYCGNPRPSFRANGFMAHRLSPATYNALLDAGYRRSGTYVYKSVNGVTCCQHLVIRLEAARFTPSRSQRKRQAKLRRLLDAGGVGGDAAGSGTEAGVWGTAPTPRRRKPAGGGGVGAGQSGSTFSAATSATADHAAGTGTPAPRPPAAGGKATAPRGDPAVVAAVVAAAVTAGAAALGVSSPVAAVGEDAAALARVSLLPRLSGSGRGAGLSRGAAAPVAGPGAASGSPLTPTPAAALTTFAGTEALVRKPAPCGVTYACNVAFVVAAATRRKASPPLPPPRLPESGHESAAPPDGRPTKATYLAAKAAASAAATEAQMATAVAVAPALRAVPGVLRVEVVAPGFVNVWLRAAAAGAGWDAHKGGTADSMDSRAVEEVASSRLGVVVCRSASHAPRGASDPGASDAGVLPAGATDTQRLLTRLGFPAAGGRHATVNGWSTARMQEGGDPAEGANGSAGASGDGSSGTDSDKCAAGAPLPCGGGALPTGGLRVSLAPAAFHEDEFELYKAYQAAIHDKAPTSYTPSGYNNFLVESPLPSPSESWPGISGTGNDSSDSGDDPPVPAPPCGYGTFHARYELDGTLIAVAVLDILPRCVSSVYLFYAPAYGHLSLGSLSALHEIAHTASLTPTCPDLRYYYMGYYIHRCPKMAYKGSYAPSELLCEATQTWVPLSEAVARLRPGGRAPVEARPAASTVADANGDARVHVGEDSACDQDSDCERDSDSNSGDDSDEAPPARRHGGGSDGHGDVTAVVRLAPLSVPAVPAPALDEATLADVEVMVFVRGGCVRLRLGEVEAWMVTAVASSSFSASSGASGDRRRRRRGGGSIDSGSGGGSSSSSSREPAVAAAVSSAVANLRRRVTAFAATAGVAVAVAAAYVLEVDW